MPIWPKEPDEEPAITSVLIHLDSLSAGERRDLANALLRAAWSAALARRAPEDRWARC